MNAGCSEQPDRLSCQNAFEYRIQLEHAGLRLDHYLVLQLPSLSRSQLTHSIKSGFVTVDGKLAKASHKLKAGEMICGIVQDSEPVDIVAQKIAFEILYEDEELLIISKPPQLVVHPGSGNPDKTLVNGLVHYCVNIADVGDSLRPGIVHRLDKDTSGIMVVAKTNTMHRLLVDDFKERRVKKIYLALVHGLMEDEGRICLPIGRHPVNRKKMAVREHNGKFAASNWRVEKTFLNRYSLVKIAIETGRTHQIRVHMASLGHPVAGDVLYGQGKDNSLFPRQMLHSSEISFTHPLSGSEIHLRAPIWSDMSNVISSLEYSGKPR